MGRKSRRRVCAYVLAFIAFGALLPTGASAQTVTTALSPPVCTPLVLPEDTASAVEDFLMFGTLCAEDHVTIKVDEVREHFTTENVKEREREEEITIRRRDPVVVQSAPVDIRSLEVEELAQLGFKTKVEETREVREVNGNRSEERIEETKIEGDDFRFKSEETRERTENEDSTSFEREESQTFKSRG